MTPIPPRLDPAVALAQATRPLLELFAAMDDVFTEPDALSAHNRQVSLGRCYTAYKKARKQLDPDYKERKISAKVGDSRRASEASTTMPESARIVLRTRRRRKD